MVPPAPNAGTAQHHGAGVTLCPRCHRADPVPSRGYGDVLGVSGTLPSLKSPWIFGPATAGDG